MGERFACQFLLRMENDMNDFMWNAEVATNWTLVVVGIVALVLLEIAILG